MSVDQQNHVFTGYKNPFGADIKLDPKRCARGLMDNYKSYQCRRKGSIEEDGHIWCKTHAPSNIKAKREKQEAQWNHEWALRKSKHSAETAMLEIAETTILHFRQQATFDQVEQAVIKYERLKTQYDNMKRD